MKIFIPLVLRSLPDQAAALAAARFRIRSSQFAKTIDAKCANTVFVEACAAQELVS